MLGDFADRFAFIGVAQPLNRLGQPFQGLECAPQNALRFFALVFGRFFVFVFVEVFDVVVIQFDFVALEFFGVVFGDCGVGTHDGVPFNKQKSVSIGSMIDQRDFFDDHVDEPPHLCFIGC